jgi:hypothetical protein
MHAQHVNQDGSVLGVVVCVIKQLDIMLTLAQTYALHVNQDGRVPGLVVYVIKQLDIM